jgi:AcrR family transcriptional regulator
MKKGDITRQAILDEALILASQAGIGALSIGVLAERAGLSKSGLFAHFGSKEEMQLAVLRDAQERFLDVVFRPVLRSAKGIARLRAIFGNWLGWTQKLKLPGGCLMLAASHEFDDQPGALRDTIENGQHAWRRTLGDAVSKSIDTGELRADTDIEQFVFEIVGIIMVAQQNRHLFKDPEADRRAFTAFDRLVRDHAAKE